MSKGYERTKKPEDLLNEELLTQIPSDPQKEEIIEILAKSPSVISYIQNILSDTKSSISMKKLLIKAAERELEQKQSQARLDTQQRYQKKLRDVLDAEPKRRQELVDLGFKEADIRERLKLERPDKPTATDLKDVSNIKTRDYYEKNIAPLETELQKLEEQSSYWKVRYDLFENNFKASQSIKGLIQQEMNNYKTSN